MATSPRVPHMVTLQHTHACCPKSHFILQKQRLTVWPTPHISKVPTGQILYCVVLETECEFGDHCLGESPLSACEGIPGLGLHLDIPVRDCGDQGN